MLAISKLVDRYFRDLVLSKFHGLTLSKAGLSEPFDFSNFVGEARPFFKIAKERKTFGYGTSCPGFRFGYESKLKSASIPSRYIIAVANNGKMVEARISFLRVFPKETKFRKASSPRFFGNSRSASGKDHYRHFKELL